MNLDLIREILNPYLEEKGFSLYDVKERRENGDLFISVFVDKKGGISIDDLAMVNEFLSEELDKTSFSELKYFLEVSSPGAERDIRNLDEVKEAVGSYIYVEQEGQKYEGTFVEFQEPDTIVLRVNLKGRFKNFTFSYAKLNKIHYAIKF